MAPPEQNLQKKGEHVFNDLAGSLENSITSALRTQRGNSLVLRDRHGELRMPQLPRTLGCLARLRNDPILAQAQTVVGAATGMHDDANARTYGHARLNLERVLSDAVMATAALIGEKKPRPNRSFREFEQSIVASLLLSGSLKLEAFTSVGRLIDSSPGRRRAAIAGMKQHLPTLNQAGYSLVTIFLEEVEKVLEFRIGAA